MSLIQVHYRQFWKIRSKKSFFGDEMSTHNGYILRMSDVHIYEPPVDDGLNIIHQDADIIVVSKPSGLLSVPGRAETHKDCLESRVRAEFPDARIVHRLDMDTSGIMVLARNVDSHRHLSIQFEKRKPKKAYIALLWGHVADDSGRVDLPIRCDWENRPRQIVDFEQGKPSQTDWEVLKRNVSTPLICIPREGGDPGLSQKTPASAGDAQSLTRVLLKPVTGRTHQLRVHMQEMGYPILGDDFYAHEDAFNAAERLCLHAQDLGFYHPATNDWMDFTDTCPF